MIGAYIRLSEEERSERLKNDEKDLILLKLKRIKQFCIDNKILLVFKGNSLEKYAFSSIVNQFDMINEHCEKNSTFIKTLYIDLETGYNWERFAFVQMLKDAEEGRISQIIVKDLSRFGRNAPARELTLRDLQTRGIKVYPLMQPDLAKEENTSFRQMQGIMDEHIITTNREKQKHLIKSKLEKGLPFTKSPRGYINKNKEWLVDKKKAEEVKQIFELAKSEMKPLEIAKKFKISLKTYFKIIHNKCYLGYVSYWHYTKDSYGKPIKKERIEFKGKHEPIISEELFNQVNETR